MPVFDALNKVGWQPVTHARADGEGVLVERYGSGEDSLLAVYNASGEAREVTLSLDAAWWKKAHGGAAPTALHSLLSGDVVPIEAAGDGLSCRVRIDARRTVVLGLRAG